MPLTLLHPKYWSTWIGLFFLRLLSMLNIDRQHKLVRAIALPIGRHLKRRKHFAEVNIGLCFPELSVQEQHALLEKNITSTFLAVVETAQSWWATDKEIQSLYTFEGLELLEQAKNEGRGVLLIGIHSTTINLAGRFIGQETDLDITYKFQKNKALDYFINSKRSRSFNKLIEKQCMFQMVKRLKAGRVVWYAPDQDFGKKGSVFAPFFGRPAATVSAIGRLLALTNAKPLFYSVVRDDNAQELTYRAKIHDPFQDEFGSDDLENATLLNKVIEDVIRKQPDQYLWVHERFRSREDRSVPKPYKISKKKKR